MTSRELLYVKTISEEKSISKAAKKLYMAQPSLSQSLQRIEEVVGAQLFNRTANGLVLTYAGERYCTMANQILKMYENFELEVSDINNLKTGRIHLGITSHLGTIVLPKVLPQFKELFPFVEIHITETNSTELEALLLSGSLDFCIMHAPKEPPKQQIEFEFLTKDPFLLITKKDHPLKEHACAMEGYPYPVMDLHALKEESFIMLYEPQRIRQVTDAVLKKAGIHSPSIYLTVRNFETAQRLAITGIGITMLPMQYAQISCTEEGYDSYCILESYDANWDMCIATNQNGFLSKADLLFLRMIRESFGIK